MCGLVAILNLDPGHATVGHMRKIALAMALKIRHRGPDWSGIYSDAHAILAHERLSIVDVEHGAQPLLDTRTGAVLAVNGEIYNHRDLRRELRQPHDFQTASDCEVILYLHDELPPRDFLNRMNGIFAFVLHDPQRGS
ncbi:asparagine synthetase B (fragment) [Georgfuchsia toluolica]|uniref:Asparagine synthetase B n=1 Tax=Georgfuchsia toluolica TaxID=424218 RepID=A0A916N870_9PROT